MTAQKRCPDCGYTAADKRRYGDHHLCVSQKRKKAAMRDPDVVEVEAQVAALKAEIVRLEKAIVSRDAEIDRLKRHQGRRADDPEYRKGSQ